MTGALYWYYGNPDSTPNEELPPMVMFPQYRDSLLQFVNRGRAQP